MILIPNSFDDFALRMQDLQAEARKYGFISVVCMLDLDRLEEVENKTVVYTGGPTMAMGMSEVIKHKATMEMMGVGDDK